MQVKIRVPEKQSKQIESIKSEIRTALPGPDSPDIHVFIGSLGVIGIVPDPGPDVWALIRAILERYRELG